MDEFYEYFKKLSNDITVLANDEADQLYSSHDFSGDDATFLELDQPITVSDITDAVKTLNTCKATGNDFLLNEYFIEGIDILSSHLCDLFNSILNSGYFPDQWSEGIIVPVHKRAMFPTLKTIFTNIYNGSNIYMIMSGKRHIVCINNTEQNECYDLNI